MVQPMKKIPIKKLLQGLAIRLGFAVLIAGLTFGSVVGVCSLMEEPSTASTLPPEMPPPRWA